MKSLQITLQGKTTNKHEGIKTSYNKKNIALSLKGPTMAGGACSDPLARRCTALRKIGHHTIDAAVSLRGRPWLRRQATGQETRCWRRGALPILFFAAVLKRMHLQFAGFCWGNRPERFWEVLGSLRGFLGRSPFWRQLHPCMLPFSNLIIH